MNFVQISKETVSEGTTMKMSRVYNAFRAMWEKDRSFTILLGVLLVHIFVIVPYMQDTRYGRIAYSAFFLLLLWSGLHAILGDKTSTLVISLFLKFWLSVRLRLPF